MEQSLELMPERITKETIREKADLMMNLIDEGHVSAMDVALRLKYFEDLSSAVKERFRRYVLDDLSKYAKGERIVRYNALFTVKEAGVKYDYSACGDPVWDSLNGELERIKGLMKDREKFLKSIKGSMTIVNEETGEVATVREPLRTSTETYQIEWQQ